MYGWLGKYLGCDTKFRALHQLQCACSCVQRLQKILYVVIAYSIAMGGIVGAACSYWCTGNIDPCSAGCGGFCAGTCSGICAALLIWLGLPANLSYFCDRYACVPACTGACETVC